MQIAASFEQAMLREYPQPISLVIVKAGGKYNPMPLGWLMTTSREPPMLALAAERTRYTLELIRQAREFVISFPPSTMGKEILYYGTNSGRFVDKFAETPVRTQPATRVDGVLLTDAVANFECRLVGSLETGDHTIFVGEVLAAHRGEADGPLVNFGDGVYARAKRNS
ncbi:MAG TPA: flavin reductase family protein, partial [Phycisphaerae bacterium]|nr:flavin reductase family protein [Phycisphaerae bacterium]